MAPSLKEVNQDPKRVCVPRVEDFGMTRDRGFLPAEVSATEDRLNRRG